MSNPTSSTISTAAEKQQKFADQKSSSAASSTSIYTTEEKKDHYSTLPEVLESKCEDPQLRQVIQDLMQVCADITDALRISLVTVEGSTNDFGDSQLSVDVSLELCNETIDRINCSVCHSLTHLCCFFLFLLKRSFRISYCGKPAASLLSFEREHRKRNQKFGTWTNMERESSLSAGEFWIKVCVFLLLRFFFLKQILLHLQGSIGW